MHDDVRLARIRREAKSIISADPALGWSWLGIGDMLCADYEGMRAKFENALKFSPSERTHLQYAAMLLNAGFFSEARLHAGAAADPYLWMTRETVVCMLYVGRIFHARDLVIKFRPFLENADQAFLEELLVSIDLAEQKGVRESTITAALDFAGEIMRTHRLIFVNDDPFQLGTPSAQSRISYVFRLDVSESECARMNCELAKLIAANLMEFPAELIPVAFDACGSVDQAGTSSYRNTFMLGANTQT
jgi:hypothetical protein